MYDSVALCVLSYFRVTSVMIRLTYRFIETVCDFIVSILQGYLSRRKSKTFNLNEEQNYAKESTSKEKSSRKTERQKSEKAKHRKRRKSKRSENAAEKQNLQRSKKYKISNNKGGPSSSDDLNSSDNQSSRNSESSRDISSYSEQRSGSSPHGICVNNCSQIFQCNLRKARKVTVAFEFLANKESSDVEFYNFPRNNVIIKSPHPDIASQNDLDHASKDENASENGGDSDDQRSEDNATGETTAENKVPDVDISEHLVLKSATSGSKALDKDLSKQAPLRRKYPFEVATREKYSEKTDSGDRGPEVTSTDEKCPEDTASGEKYPLEVATFEKYSEEIDSGNRDTEVTMPEEKSREETAPAYKSPAAANKRLADSHKKAATKDKVSENHLNKIIPDDEHQFPAEENNLKTLPEKTEPKAKHLEQIYLEGKRQEQITYLDKNQEENQKNIASIFKHDAEEKREAEGHTRTESVTENTIPVVNATNLKPDQERATPDYLPWVNEDANSRSKGDSTRGSKCPKETDIEDKVSKGIISIPNTSKGIDKEDENSVESSTSPKCKDRAEKHFREQTFENQLSETIPLKDSTSSSQFSPDVTVTNVKECGVISTEFKHEHKKKSVEDNSHVELHPEKSSQNPKNFEDTKADPEHETDQPKDIALRSRDIPTEHERNEETAKKRKSFKGAATKHSRDKHTDEETPENKYTVKAYSENESEYKYSKDTRTGNQWPVKNTAVRNIAKKNNFKQTPVEQIVRKQTHVQRTAQKPTGQEQEQVNPTGQELKPVKHTDQEKQPAKHNDQEKHPDKAVGQEQKPVKAVGQEQKPVKAVGQEQKPVKTTFQKQYPTKSTFQKQYPTKSTLKDQQPAKLTCQEKLEKPTGKEEKLEKPTGKEQKPTKHTDAEEMPAMPTGQEKMPVVSTGQVKHTIQGQKSVKSTGQMLKLVKLSGQKQKPLKDITPDQKDVMKTTPREKRFNETTPYNKRAEDIVPERSRHQRPGNPVTDSGHEVEYLRSKDTGSDQGCPVEIASEQKTVKETIPEPAPERPREFLWSHLFKTVKQHEKTPTPTTPHEIVHQHPKNTVSYTQHPEEIAPEHKPVTVNKEEESTSEVKHLKEPVILLRPEEKHAIQTQETVHGLTFDGKTYFCGIIDFEKGPPILITQDFMLNPYERTEKYIDSNSKISTSKNDEDFIQDFIKSDKSFNNYIMKNIHQLGKYAVSTSTDVYWGKDGSILDKKIESQKDHSKRKLSECMRFSFKQSEITMPIGGVGTSTTIPFASDKVDYPLFDIKEEECKGRIVDYCNHMTDIPKYFDREVTRSNLSIVEKEEIRCIILRASATKQDAIPLTATASQHRRSGVKIEISRDTEKSKEQYLEAIPKETANKIEEREKYGGINPIPTKMTTEDENPDITIYESLSLNSNNRNQQAIQTGSVEIESVENVERIKQKHVKHCKKISSKGKNRKQSKSEEKKSEEPEFDSTYSDKIKREKVSDNEILLHDQVKDPDLEKQLKETRLTLPSHTEKEHSVTKQLGDTFRSTSQKTQLVEEHKFECDSTSQENQVPESLADTLPSTSQKTQVVKEHKFECDSMSKENQVPVWSNVQLSSISDDEDSFPAIFFENAPPVPITQDFLLNPFESLEKDVDKKSKLITSDYREEYLTLNFNTNDNLFFNFIMNAEKKLDSSRISSEKEMLSPYKIVESESLSQSSLAESLKVSSSKPVITMPSGEIFDYYNPMTGLPKYFDKECVKSNISVLQKDKIQCIILRGAEQSRERDFSSAEPPKEEDPPLEEPSQEDEPSLEELPREEDPSLEEPPQEEDPLLEKPREKDPLLERPPRKEDTLLEEEPREAPLEKTPWKENFPLKEALRENSLLEERRPEDPPLAESPQEEDLPLARPPQEEDTPLAGPPQEEDPPLTGLPLEEDLQIAEPQIEHPVVIPLIFDDGTRLEMKHIVPRSEEPTKEIGTKTSYEKTYKINIFHEEQPKVTTIEDNILVGSGTGLNFENNQSSMSPFYPEDTLSSPRESTYTSCHNPNSLKYEPQSEEDLSTENEILSDTTDSNEKARSEYIDTCEAFTSTSLETEVVPKAKFKDYSMFLQKQTLELESCSDGEETCTILHEKRSPVLITGKIILGRHGKHKKGMVSEPNFENIQLEENLLKDDNLTKLKSVGEVVDEENPMKGPSTSEQGTSEKPDVLDDLCPITSKKIKITENRDFDDDISVYDMDICSDDEISINLETYPSIVFFPDFMLNSYEYPEQGRDSKTSLTKFEFDKKYSMCRWNETDKIFYKCAMNTEYPGDCPASSAASNEDILSSIKTDNPSQSCLPNIPSADVQLPSDEEMPQSTSLKSNIVPQHAASRDENVSKRECVGKIVHYYNPMTGYTKYYSDISSKDGVNVLSRDEIQNVVENMASTVKQNTTVLTPGVKKVPAIPPSRIGEVLQTPSNMKEALEPSFLL